MFIAHGPCGYLLSIATLKRLSERPASSTVLIGAGVFGAIFPDIDLFYFYLIDERNTHHHRFFTHWPILWLGLLLCSAWVYSKRRVGAAMLLFSLGGFSHMILDSLVSDIWWFAPFVDKPFSLAVVTDRYDPWWLNFLLHWSFAVELLICGCALALWRKRRRAAQSQRRTFLQ